MSIFWRAFGILAVVLALSSSSRGFAAEPSHRASAPVNNRAIVEHFASLFYEQHKVREAFENYVDVHYIQHSPDIADGRDAAIAILEPMFNRPNFVVHVRQIIVDRDMAVLMVHADREGSAGSAIIDIFRLKGGKIVEHWDVNQLIPIGAVNRHPLF